MLHIDDQVSAETSKRRVWREAEDEERGKDNQLLQSSSLSSDDAVEEAWTALCVIVEVAFTVSCDIMLESESEPVSFEPWFVVAVAVALAVSMSALVVLEDFFAEDVVVSAESVDAVVEASSTALEVVFVEPFALDVVVAEAATEVLVSSEPLLLVCLPLEVTVNCTKEMKSVLSGDELKRPETHIDHVIEGTVLRDSHKDRLVVRR